MGQGGLMSCENMAASSQGYRDRYICASSAVDVLLPQECYVDPTAAFILGDTDDIKFFRSIRLRIGHG